MFLFPIHSSLISAGQVGRKILQTEGSWLTVWKNHLRWYSGSGPPPEKWTIWPMFSPSSPSTSGTFSSTTQVSHGLQIQKQRWIFKVENFSLKKVLKRTYFFGNISQWVFHTLFYFQSFSIFLWTWNTTQNILTANSGENYCSSLKLSSNSVD